MNQQQIQPTRRSGISTFELTVAMMVLMVVMTVMTSLCFRIQQIWQDVGHHRIATNELSNQLDALTTLPIDQVEQQLSRLQASARCQNALNQPKLSGELFDESLGQRLELRLQWRHGAIQKTIQLSAWIVPTSEEALP